MRVLVNRSTPASNRSLERCNIHRHKIINKRDVLRVCRPYYCRVNMLPERERHPCIVDVRPDPAFAMYCVLALDTNQRHEQTSSLSQPSLRLQRFPAASLFRCSSVTVQFHRDLSFQFGLDSLAEVANIRAVRPNPLIPVPTHCRVLVQAISDAGLSH
jgi:hypothetical protein